MSVACFCALLRLGTHCPAQPHAQSFPERRHLSDLGPREPEHWSCLGL